MQCSPQEGMVSELDWKFLPSKLLTAGLEVINLSEAKFFDLYHGEISWTFLRGLF